MPRRISISAGGVTIEAQLNESPTADRIWEGLPMSGQVNTWGDEIYFEIPVVAEEAADARAEVSVGELGYWPVGRAFCVFFGPTPASTGEEPRAASPVNVVGHAVSDATQLRNVAAGETVTLERA